jgi:hypothetical protein
MSTPETSMDPAQVEADLKAVMDHVTGVKPLDPDQGGDYAPLEESIRVAPSVEGADAPRVAPADRWRCPVNPAGRNAFTDASLSNRAPGS